MPRGHGDPPVTDLPGCSLAAGELLHHQGGEDTDAAVKVTRPEAIIHLARGTRQHPDDGPLREAQLLGALPLIVVQGSHQPGCREDGVGGLAPLVPLPLQGLSIPWAPALCICSPPQGR